MHEGKHMSVLAPALNVDQGRAVALGLERDAGIGSGSSSTSVLGRAIGQWSVCVSISVNLNVTSGDIFSACWTFNLCARMSNATQLYRIIG